MRRKIDIRKLAYTLTEKDVKEAIEQENIRRLLGIYTVYDDVQNKKVVGYIPSMYKSLDEYEIDKSEADNYIYNNQPVPDALASKLIAARIELEKRNLIKKYNG